MRLNHIANQKLTIKIRDCCNQFLRTKINDSRLKFVSFTKAHVSGDGKLVTMYWDSFDLSKRSELEKAMKGLTKGLQGHLGAFLKRKVAPSVSIVFDTQFIDEQRIDELLSNPT